MKTLEWTKSVDEDRDQAHRRFTLSAPKKMAGGEVCDNGIEIDAGVHYNGSGPKAFGGAKDWPVVDLQIAFEQGQDAERDQFIEALKQFVTDYFSK